MRSKRATNATLLTIVSLTSILSAPILAASEQATSAPCSQPKSRQFDFWLGEWNLEWNLKGKSGKGVNVIGSILGGCVIKECFDGRPAIPLQGMSVSAYNIKTGKWQQTWVDNEGSYLDFTGEFKDNRMVLQRRALRDGKEVLQRMLWYDITKDRLTWNWERSDDEGKTWTVLWQIKYSRKR
jgi:hypothetical protein